MGAALASHLHSHALLVLGTPARPTPGREEAALKRQDIKRHEKKEGPLLVSTLSGRQNACTLEILPSSSLPSPNFIPLET